MKELDDLKASNYNKEKLLMDMDDQELTLARINEEASMFEEGVLS